MKALTEAVALPWFEIIALIQRGPNTYQLSPEKLEEMIAGIYKARVLMKSYLAVTMAAMSSPSRKESASSA
jgi:hypothetical protein